MVNIFRDYGEVVLAIGSSYKPSNSSVFASANIAVPLNMLPDQTCGIPINSYR